MKPNSALHRPDPAYLRGLIESTGLTQVRAAFIIGIAPRTMRSYLSDKGSRAPYPVQYALERLAG